MLALNQMEVKGYIGIFNEISRGLNIKTPIK